VVVWLEALTGKQARLMHLVAEELERRGYETLVTAREYDYTVTVLRMLGREPVVVGRYGGRTLRGKLLASVERQLKLARLVSKLSVEAHVCFTSPDSSRVAFGLGIPILALSDSPHSHFVNRLSLPLAERLVAPRCVPAERFARFIEVSRIVQFNGFFELAWVLRARPTRAVLRELGLREGRYVVLRPEERYAAYYEGGSEEPTVIGAAIEAVPDDYDIVLFPRYPEQRAYVKGRYGDRVIMPRDSVDTVSLAYYSALVVTGGSTLAQEAALLGVRAITYFPRELETASEISRLGFPLTRVASPRELGEAVSAALSEDTRRVDVSHLLSKLEDPVPVIADSVEEVAKRPR